MSGIPHAVVIDATGKVVFDGGPGGITEDVVKKALVGALKKPLWELPKSFAKVRAAIGKGDLSVALKEAQTLSASANAPEEAAGVAESLKGMIAGALSGAESMETVGDFLGAQKEYERLVKSAKGLPEEATARQKLAALAKNPEAKKGIKAQKDLDTILAEPIRSEKDQRDMKAALEAFIKKNDGNFASKRAKDELAKFDKH